MKPNARLGSAEDLSHVGRFYGHQVGLPIGDRLPDWELVKIKDLVDDVAREEKWSSAAITPASTRLGRLIERMRYASDHYLGRVFARFERFVGSASVGRMMAAFARMTGSHSHRLNNMPSCHQPPPGASAQPEYCAADFWLFDRISQKHGGKFRGSVVANCVLGVAASAALLFSLSPPLGAQWVIKVFREVHPSAGNIPVATVIEFVCILMIGLIYARGRSPDQDDRPPPRMSPRLGTQRWHQRWLEYRLLAERFRYVDLLLPLGHKAVLGMSIAPPTDAGRMWHQRYFERRLKEIAGSEHTHAAKTATQTVRAYRDHVLAVMAQQEEYHRGNHHRRGVISHRLHLAGKLAFFSTLAICIFEFAWDIVCEHHPFGLSCEGTDHVRLTLLFLAGLLPVCSAATYAIATHAEYAKVADTSAETFERVHSLYEKLAALPVPHGDVSAPTLAPMRPFVLEFAGIAITEATGWRAMLRDKNVPLA